MYYNACDVVIIPSRWEAFGLVAIEAMKYGKLLIVSNRGALPEIVADEVTGYVFEMGNENSLLKILYSMENKLQAMEIRAREEFSKNYTDNKMLMKIYNVYREVLEQKTNYEKR